MYTREVCKVKMKIMPEKAFMTSMVAAAVKKYYFRRIQRIWNGLRIGP